MLDKVTAIFYESARMFRELWTVRSHRSTLIRIHKAAGHVMIREATEDTVLTVPNPAGEEGSKTIPIPKGTQIMVDMVGARTSDAPHRA
jgi:hypothetical protein